MTFTINTKEFSKTLSKYLEYNKRDAAFLVNDRAWKVARGAANLTKRADYSLIAQELGVALRTVQKGRRAGGLTMGKKAKFYDTTGQGLSLAQLIIIVRLRNKGTLKDVTRAIIDQMAQKMIGARARSIGWLAAGWLPAIKLLGQSIGKTGFYSDKQLKGFKNNTNLGHAIVARGSISPKAIIENKSGMSPENKRALLYYGTTALQQSINEQTADMIQYIKRKMVESARRLGIKAR